MRRHARLACALALALLPARAPCQDEAQRLVVVTFERRAGPPFGAHPEVYGDSLAAWRGQVLDLLFTSDAAGPGTGTLLRSGDAVALFADGAPQEFPGRAPLGSGSSGERVGQVLRGMLTLPGAPGEPAPAFRLIHAAGRGDRERVDAGIRGAITCALADAPPDCVSEGGAMGDGVNRRGFSRPLLTFPEQFRAASAAFARERGELPTEVYWIWVQAGGRVNEVNSLAAEIVRDFGDSPAGKAVERHRARAARSMTFRLLAHGGRSGEEGAVALWKVTSASLERMMNPPASLPLALEARRDSAWQLVDLRFDPRPGFFESTPGLLPPGALRVALAPPRAVAKGDLLRVRATLRCAGSGAAADTVVLPDDAWVLRGETAYLDAAATRRVHAHAARCLPSQRLGAIFGRQALRRRVPVDWTMEVAALVASRADTTSLAAPPVLTTLTVRRSWAQSLLGKTEYLILAACAVAALLLLGRWVRHFFSPTVLVPVLQGPDGAELMRGVPLPLALGGGEPTRVQLALVRRSGRRRAGQVTVPVWGTGLQAEVPLRPDAEAARVVEVRHPGGDAAGRVDAPLQVQVPVLRRGAGAVPLALYAPDSVVEVDRTPVGVALRAGIEVEVAAAAARGIRVLSESFYVPCTLQLEHVRVRRPPGLLVRLDQGYLYRGLRIDPRDWSSDVPMELGTLRIVHPAERGVTARPYPVRLELRVRALARPLAAAPDAAEPVRAAIRHAGEAAADLILELDQAELDLPLEVWPAQLLAAAAATGWLEVEVRGAWREVRKDMEGPPRALESARETIRVYPSEMIHGVAVDFGTSATRMAFLADMEGPEKAAAICIPDPLIPASADTDPETWPGELDSEVGVDAGGHVVRAGNRGLLDADGRGFESLKQALMDDPSDHKAWTAAGEVIRRLGELVEQGGGRLRLARWVDGDWRRFSRELPAPFRYLLLVTVPDSFTHAEQNELRARFAGWGSAVEVFPLREAEAVVYGFLRRGKGSRPARTLVVDVGAGTVDYAAVRCTFVGDTLGEIAVEGLSVSRAAGNRFDQAVARFVGATGPARKLRGIKEARFTDPEALHAPPTAEVEEFLAHQSARDYFHTAIDAPLDALLGRLSLQPGWTPPRFDQVVLSGRGSLGAGWKQHLAAALSLRGLVPANAERAWLHWLGAGEGRGVNRVRAQAERLKGAVAEGALALLAFEQTRIQTSRDILRDHLILISQDSGGFQAKLLLAAGDVIPAAGLPAAPVDWGGWTRAWLVYSSHPPSGGAPGVPGYDAEQLWRAIDADGATPVVRRAGESPRPRPGQERGAVLRVRVERGGEVHWVFQPKPERSLTA